MEKLRVLPYWNIVSQDLFLGIVSQDIDKDKMYYIGLETEFRNSNFIKSN